MPSLGFNGFWGDTNHQTSSSSKRARAVLLRSK